MLAVDDSKAVKCRPRNTDGYLRIKKGITMDTGAAAFVMPTHWLPMFELKQPEGQRKGTKYVGAWELDNQHGKGKEFWSDGTKYEGLYKEGKKEGYGEFLMTDKSTYMLLYTGNFSDNKIEGEGKCKWANGR